MNPFHESNLIRQHDEVSLSEIAAIFVVRWRLLLLSLIATFVLGVVGLSFVTDKEEFTSLYRLPLTGSGEPIVMGESLVAQVESQWLPELELSIATEEGRKLPFGVDIDSPKQTFFLRLRSDASVVDKDMVVEVHRRLFDNVNSELSGLVASSKEVLTSELDMQRELLSRLEGMLDSAEPYAKAYQHQAALRSSLEHFRDGQTLVLARSGDKAGPSNALLLLLLIFLSIFIAFGIVVLAEFSAHVRAVVRRQSDYTEEPGNARRLK